jgi:DNA primase large subunit
MILGRRKKANQSSLTEGRDSKRYPDRLQMYKLPPTDNISLEEFEELAIERLKSK